MDDILLVQKREKGSKTKSSVLCLQVVKLYNSGMGRVDLMDQRMLHIVWIKSHLLDFNSAFSLIWWISHVSILTSFITWSTQTNCLSLNTRLFTKNLIQYHQGRKRAVPMSRPSERKNQPEPIHNHGGYLPDYQKMTKRCAYCAMEGKENRTFFICLARKIPLRLVKERNFFQKHHI